MSWSYVVGAGALVFLAFDFLYPPKAPKPEQADGESEKTVRGHDLMLAGEDQGATAAIKSAALHTGGTNPADIARQLGIARSSVSDAD